MTYRPRVYCASKLRHHAMWHEWSRDLRHSIHVVSTWHDHPDVEALDAVPAICRDHWQLIRMQILHKAEHLLVFGEADDPLNGTLVEIGMAIAMNLPVHLVGDFKWGTWRYMRGVKTYATLHDALVGITNANPNAVTNEMDRISIANNRSNPRDET